LQESQEFGWLRKHGSGQHGSTCFGHIAGWLGVPGVVGVEGVARVRRPQENMALVNTALVSTALSASAIWLYLPAD
jgi:hypothetical protein